MGKEWMQFIEERFKLYDSDAIDKSTFDPKIQFCITLR